jgi:hypothetical protein
MASRPFRPFPILVCLCATALACGASTTGPDAGGQSPTGQAAPRVAPRFTPADVQVFGALWALGEGKRAGPGAHVSLSHALRRPHTYAVGVLSGLRGEVTVLDGDIWLAYDAADRNPRGGAVQRSDEHAALLVAATVDRWREVPLRTAIDAGELDRRLEELATAAGLELDRPLPVRIEGRFTRLRWSARPGGKTALVPEATGTLVGFFSRRHRGVFTPHSSSTHLHMVLAPLNLSGHVERVTVEPGAKVYFPQG